MIKPFFKNWIIAVGIHLALALSIIWYYYNDAALRWEAIPIHALLILSCFSLILSLSILLSCKANGRVQKLFLPAFMHVGLSIWLILIHISAAISFFFWSDKVTIQAVFEYIPTLHLLAEHAGHNANLVITMIVSVFFLLIYLWIYWGKRLNQLFEKITKISLSKIQITGLILVIVISSGILFYFRYAIQSDRMQSLRSEPFANFFRESTIFSLRYKPTDIDLKDHLEAKDLFKSNIPDEFNSANVILIMLDAARADHMSVYGYDRQTTPFLDSLYAENLLHRVEFATSTCTQSSCGISAMLSSVFFTRVHNVNYLIHDALHDAGYETYFLLSGDHSRAYSFMKQYYGTNVDFFRDGFSTPGSYQADDQLLLNYFDELPDFRNENPAFLYFHLMSPHLLGKKYPEFTHFKPSSMNSQMDLFIRGLNGDLEPADHKIIKNNYDNGILQADHFIEQVFNSLNQKGYLDNSIVVITSDHGEALGENGNYGHARDIHKTAINVPLLIYYPDHITENEQISYGTLIDIAPTIFGLLDLPAPVSWEGIDLLNNERINSFHISTFINGNQAVIKKHEDKMFMLGYSRFTGKYTAYDLFNDPYTPVALADSIKEKLLELYMTEFSELK